MPAPFSTHTKCSVRTLMNYITRINSDKFSSKVSGQEYSTLTLIPDLNMNFSIFNKDFPSYCLQSSSFCILKQQVSKFKGKRWSWERERASTRVLEFKDVGDRQLVFSDLGKCMRQISHSYFSVFSMDSRNWPPKFPNYLFGGMI
jgi:hypothetical protein